jgi:hypothetical protein
MKKPIWPPPKPEFQPGMINSATLDQDYGPLFDGCRVITKHDFNDWYRDHIESLGPAVEVTGSKDGDDWIFSESIAPLSDDTHSALLIGISQLKEESAEDLLAQVVKQWNEGYDVGNIMDLADRFLEKKGRKV